MNKFLKRIGYYMTKDEPQPIEPTKTKEEIDLDKMIQFAGKIKSVSDKLAKCDRVKENLLAVDRESRYLASYNSGWRVAEYDIKDLIDMDEVYTFIYNRVKEKEFEMKSQLKEYTQGCVLAQ